jgi:hypothetical protein
MRAGRRPIPDDAAEKMTQIIESSSYGEYVRAQIDKFLDKRELVWVEDPEIEQIAKLIMQRRSVLGLGLCHGVRTGHECRRLSKLLGIEVWGTDIGTIDGPFMLGSHDFHEPLPFDMEGMVFAFVYSNSLDHSYDPTKALGTWKSQLSGQGMIILHWERSRAVAYDTADCFGGSLDEYAELLEQLEPTSLDIVPTPIEHRYLLTAQFDET